VKRSTAQLFCFVIVLIVARGQASDVRKDLNYDESKVVPYTLPDPLIAQNRTAITDTATWQTKRRGELLELFKSQVYGRSPNSPQGMIFRLTDNDPSALGGKATRREVAIRICDTPDSPEIHVLVYIPNGSRGPYPAFLIMNFQGNHELVADPGVTINKRWVWERKQEVRLLPAESTRGASGDMQWPLERVIERGYALVTFDRNEIEPDYLPAGWRRGVRGFYLKQSGRGAFAADEWGTLGAWAWGMSRVLDYLETDSHIDAEKVVLMGHSRIGKAALWAGAQDERFAIVISNNSGEGGASLTRRNFGETLALLARKRPNWFCGNYQRYAGKETELGVDQHELIALMAPRPVYVASAETDRGADPCGEFLAAKHAEPVYRLFGKAGLGVEDPPPLDTPIGDYIGYHQRSGDHGLKAYDWERFMDFADRHFDRLKVTHR